MNDDMELDHNILKVGKVFLSVTGNYTPGWRPKDAFREIYQNWRDGICASFNVDHRSITPEVDIQADQSVQIAVRMQVLGHSPTNKKQLLGYIRFNQRNGTLEVTNFNAKLENRHLYLGETTKRHNNALAGGHGEGFKLAALVLLRNGYSVKLETNSFYWNFSLSRAEPQTLICRLTQPKSSVLEEKQSLDHDLSVHNVERGLTSNMWQDVTFLLGHRSSPNTNNRITREEFDTWLSVALELCPPKPADIVHVIDGDLILDKEFAGKIYLHGLYVSDESPSGKPYRYGYNFRFGTMNRDRARLTNSSVEAKMVANIWAGAMVTRGNAITDAYIELFRVTPNAPPDLLQADDYVRKPSAARILRRLKQYEPGAFYYAERSATERNGLRDEDIIVRDLRKQPEKLEKALWEILRKYNLVRTPLEEREHLFAKSAEVSPRDNIFGTNLVRALQGSFELHQDLRVIQIVFVTGGDTNIDVLYTAENKRLRVHARWLDFRRAHADMACEFYRAVRDEPVDDGTFFCDHVVQYLLDCAIDEVRVSLGWPPDEALLFKRDTMEYFRQMPRLVQVTPVADRNELEVSWSGNENIFLVQNYGKCIFYHVCLHSITSCQEKIGKIVNTSGEDVDYPPESASDLMYAYDACGCPRHLVSQADSSVTFSGLDHKQAYFAMVSRARFVSFYGFPPSPVFPNEQHTNGTPAPTRVPRQHNILSSRSSTSTMAITVDDLSVEADSSSPSPTPDIGQDLDPRVESSEQDDTVWTDWHRRNPKEVFSSLIPVRLDTYVTGEPIASIEYLDCLFERHQYVRLRLEDDATDFIAHIHDVYHSNNDFKEETYVLSFSKYIPLTSVFPFKQAFWGRFQTHGEKEVVLQFRQQGKMGLSDDAETIFLDKIVSAHNVTRGANGVEYVLPSYTGGLTEHFLCRYGIRADQNDGSASIIPVAAHLLKSTDIMTNPGFERERAPFCIELSPQVMGPAEGFAQAGFAVQAAYGVDIEKHSTWMKRHGETKIFDGPVTRILDDIEDGHLLPPGLPFPAAPRVAVIAGEHQVFRVGAHNYSMPSLREFSLPFEIVEDILEKGTVATKPDIIVLLVSTAVLHPLALRTTSLAIARLLSKKFSVHLKSMSLSDYGLPQQRKLMVIVAVPLCGMLEWPDLSSTSQPSTSIKDLIEDLGFKNGRTTRWQTVCSPPTQESTEVAQAATRHIYNYQGRPCLHRAHTYINLGDNVRPMLKCHKPLAFRDRETELTVREVARLQGIPDDLVFCGSLSNQYETVYKAVPPVVAKTIAGAILRLLRSSTVKKVGQVNTFRQLKRVKEEANIDANDDGSG